MNSIQYDYEQGHFRYMGRYSDFTNDVRNKYPSSRKEHTAICHRVSFYLMAKGLMNPCNYYIDYWGKCDLTVLVKETLYYITGMVVAVSGLCMENFMVIISSFIGERACFDREEFNIADWIDPSYSCSETPDATQKIKQYQVLLDNIGRILGSIKTPDSKDDSMLIIEGLLNRILDNLNNEFFNLSLGNASWNSSLGNALDPFELVAENDSEFLIQDAYDSAVITVLKHATLGSGENYDESELDIYTASYNNCPFVYQSCRIDIPLESSAFIKCEKPIIYNDFLYGEHNFK